MEQQAGRRPKRRTTTKYSNIVPGLALLAALALAMVGLTAVRLGFVAVEVKLGPRLSGAATTAAVAVSKPAVSKPVAEKAVVEMPVAEKAVAPKPARGWRRARVVEEAAAVATTVTDAAAKVETLATGVASLDDALGNPVTTAAAAAVPSKALAVSAGAAMRVAECAGVVTTAVNVDPTNGEIAGMTGLPDQVSYFKAKGRKPACRPLTPSR